MHIVTFLLDFISLFKTYSYIILTLFLHQFETIHASFWAAHYDTLTNSLRHVNDQNCVKKCENLVKIELKCKENRFYSKQFRIKNRFLCKSKPFSEQNLKTSLSENFVIFLLSIEGKKGTKKLYAETTKVIHGRQKVVLW